MSFPTLDLQVGRLVELGYPALLGTSAEAFRESLRPLLDVGSHGVVEDGSDAAGCILVVATPRLPAARLLPLVVRDGRTAIERLHPKAAEDFRPIPRLGLPAGEAYLLLDVDRGDDTRNRSPLEALPLLAARHRSPLTVEEGIAVLTQAPGFLQPNHCFMLPGSRAGDKRVPALWIGAGRPKLGWCWEGNRHTWLGMASCRARSRAVELPRPRRDRGVDVDDAESNAPTATSGRAPEEA